MMFEFKTPLPQYRCHKVVGALKIKKMERAGDRFNLHWLVHFEDESRAPLAMTDNWVNQHKVVEGGYLVQYSDEYVSFSPAKAFEEGYTRIES